MTPNHINHATESQHEGSTGHKTNDLKSIARKAIAPVLIAGAMLTANQAKGQNSATIDPKYYSISNPYELPNLSDKTVMNLKIKTGGSIPMSLPFIDLGSSIILTPDGRTLIGINTVNIDKPGHRQINYKINGIDLTIELYVNYQADIYAPDGTRPETVRADPGQTVRLSAGPNMNPNNNTYGYYRRRNMDQSVISQGYTDSIKTVSPGTYEVTTVDGSGDIKGTSMDTIAVIERPSANATARTLNFATTVSGIVYKVYKFQPAAAGAPMSKAPSESQTDSAWIEVPSLSFVGDGNPRSVGVELGTYKIGAQRNINTDEVKDTQNIKVDLGTDVLDVSPEEKTTFKQVNRELSRETEVPSIIYDIHGREMATALANTIKIPDQATAGVYIVRFTENGKIHTKKIVIR